jgi:hypothetical protein
LSAPPPSSDSARRRSSRSSFSRMDMAGNLAAPEGG